MTRTCQTLTLFVIALELSVFVGCAPARRRTEGGAPRAFGSILFGMRNGDDLNEGRKVWWLDYCRGIPFIGYGFVVVDGRHAGSGWTELERARYSKLDPPTSYEDNLNLLLAARKLGIIDQAVFSETAKEQIFGGRNCNYMCLRFIKDHCPDLLPDSKYAKRLRRLRWDRDYYVYAMDEGLMTEARKYIPRHQYYQEILRLCGVLRDGKRVPLDVGEVKPVPWALRIARSERFMSEDDYKRNLLPLLEHFKKRLERESVTDEPARRGQGGFGAFMTGVFIGRRVGYGLNEGRRIRGVEYLNFVPLLHLIPQLEGGLAAYSGRTANLAAWNEDRDPLAVRWEWIDMLEQCKEVGHITAEAHALLLGRLARGSYTNMRLLRRAVCDDAIEGAAYASALKRILEEPDWPLNPLNKGILDEALRVGACGQDEAKNMLRFFLGKNMPSFRLLKLARKHGVLSDKEHRNRIRLLFQRVYGDP